MSPSPPILQEREKTGIILRNPKVLLLIQTKIVNDPIRGLYARHTHKKCVILCVCLRQYKKHIPPGFRRRSSFRTSSYTKIKKLYGKAQNHQLGLEMRETNEKRDHFTWQNTIEYYILHVEHYETLTFLSID